MTCRPDTRWLPWVALALVAVTPLALSPLAAQEGASVAASMKRAEEAVARGDGIAAEMAARAAMEAGASRADVAAVMGEAELLQGDVADARDWLEPREFSPATAARGLHALGRLNMERGDMAAAALAFDAAIATGKAPPALWVDIAALRYRSGEQALALDAVTRALELAPKNAQALQMRAQLARDSGGPVAALPWFERAVGLAPDDVALMGEYAATLAEAGRHADMLTVARKMVEADPRHPQAYFLQAVLALRAGQHDIARRLMWRTDGEYDDLPVGLLLNGVIELETGNAALAVEHLDKLARMQPDNRRAQLLLGRALLANGEANELVARLAPLAAQKNADPYLLTLMGRAHEQMGDRAAAAPWLDRAAGPIPATVGAMAVDAGGELAIWRWRDDQTRAEVAVPLLRQMIGRGDNGAARAQAAALLARFPNSSDVGRLAGDVQLLTGAPAEAVPLYERSGLIRTDFALVWRLAGAERAAGRGDRAWKRLADFVAQNPRSAPALRLLATYPEEQGRWAEAAPLLLRASRLTGDSDPRLLARLARAQAGAGDKAGARASQQAAHRLQRSLNRRLPIAIPFG